MARLLQASEKPSGRYYKTPQSTPDLVLAWHTEEATSRLESMAVERAIELLRGKIPKTVANPNVFK